MKKILCFLYSKKLIGISYLGWISLIFQMVLGAAAILSYIDGFSLSIFVAIMLIVLFILQLFIDRIIEHQLFSEQTNLKNELETLRANSVEPMEVIRLLYKKLELTEKTKVTLYKIRDERIFPVGDGVTTSETMRVKLDESYSKTHLLKALEIGSFNFFQVLGKNNTDYRAFLEDNIGFPKSFTQKFKYQSQSWFIKVIREKEMPVAVLFVESQENEISYYNNSDTVVVNNQATAESLNELIESFGILNLIC